MRAPGRLRLAAARGAFKGAPRCPKKTKRNPGRMPLVPLGVAPQIDWPTAWKHGRVLTAWYSRLFRGNCANHRAEIGTMGARTNEHAARRPRGDPGGAPPPRTSPWVLWSRARKLALGTLEQWLHI